ncbi:MAG: translation initiation factor IF-2 [Candidatus Doudnabacteria bacterium]|nr:translation initiation factor IF-2 [Candidatus Doudnabacteria bacterium]
MSKKSTTQVRTPIVAVMGHVDHGKTSLLDAIRGTNVQAKEKGGITQNTRAHQIVSESGQKITFIDTPGHEAFGAMRARGAAVTDFVLLVVAADDGIQPQTKQSIEFAKSSKTPIIVAINKVDIPGVKVEKVKQQLSSFGVQVEEYGGDSMCFEVSATKGTGLKELIEGIELLAQVSELKPHQPEMGSLAEAFVLESSQDKKVGAVALCICKAGELTNRAIATSKSSEPFKVRSYLDQEQTNVESVFESDPFWVTGLKKPMQSGDRIYFFSDEKQAQKVYSEIKSQPDKASEADQLDTTSKLVALLLQKKSKEEGLEKNKLNIIVKASTFGTLEAIRNELQKLGTEESEINILSADTGDVTESDIRRAKLANGIVVSFQLPISTNIEKLAKQEKILVKNYEIIYEITDELGAVLNSLGEPAEEEVEVARARVKQVFKLSDGTLVAGAEVIKGTLLKGYRVYVERPSESTSDTIAELGRGKITNLRINKNEVKEVKKGQDCGIMIDPQVETIAEGDEVVAYKVE